ncbi:hypothetical protein EB796_012789 [Bugula neritina]|uniref:F5/8 type C domain-containing protein n=1 Tax=Bugula neritina TaxID=10212 RepID=A0A7J7JRB6_BUGNE|nr:hypothetical protein EB796_012789 [Bugula neritina]
MLHLYFSASTNLANGKATYSKTSTNDSHRPPEAVDGESNSYFQSSTSANQWWRVDLGDLIMLESLECTALSLMVYSIYVYDSSKCYDKFQQVSIFLSNTETVPNSPLNLPNNNDWTESPSQFSLTEDGDDFVTYITSSQDGSLPESRHIAVYSKSSDGLVINEVEVYGYEVLARNMAIGKSVGNSSVLSIPNYRTADKANDGLINSNDFYRSDNDVGDQWWKVDLDTQYFIVGVLVYNHKNLISRLQKAHLLAANTDVDPNPNSTEWTELYYQDGKITHSIPNNYFHLALSEVLVFGIENSELLVKNLNAEPKDQDCVKVNWETPLTDSYIFHYQVRYDSRPWKDTDTSLSDEECGFSAYKEVEVEVKIVGSDKTESTSLTTTVQVNVKNDKQIKQI